LARSVVTSIGELEVRWLVDEAGGSAVEIRSAGASTPGEIVDVASPADVATALRRVGVPDGESQTLGMALWMPIQPGYEVIDGLAEARHPYGAVFEVEEVRIRRTPETEAAGWAGVVGQIFGETKPSSSGVDDVIGLTGEDYAINVFSEERAEQAWFAPHLLEPAL
jgi:hypothetical protein